MKLNDNKIPTGVPSRTGIQTSCLDLTRLTPNLKKHLKKFIVDQNRERTLSYSTKVLYVVAPKRSGNISQINYGEKGG